MYGKLVEDLRATFKSGTTKSREYRLQQLKSLKKLYEAGETELVNALKEDLGKPFTEAVVYEIEFNKNFVISAIASMDKYKYFPKYCLTFRCLHSNICKMQRSQNVHSTEFELL